MQTEQIGDLLAALSLAQGEMQAAAKDCNNPYFKSKYADLSSVWSACREPLSKNGLSILQTTQDRDGNLYLVTTLGHKSGQYIRSEMPIRIKGDGKTNELQVLGSALTYLRRYSLSAMVGVAPEDDDGNSASTLSVQNKPATITSQQAFILNDMLKKCPAEYSEKIMNHLRNQKVLAISDLPVSLYDPLCSSIKIQLEKVENAND